MRKTFVVPDIKPLDQYDSSRARICASVGWLLAKSYGNAGIQSGRVSNPSCAAFLEGKFLLLSQLNMCRQHDKHKNCAKMQSSQAAGQVLRRSPLSLTHFISFSNLACSLTCSFAHCSVTAEESMCEGEECVNSAFFTTQRPYERWKAAGCGPAVSYYDMHSFWLS